MSWVAIETKCRRSVNENTAFPSQLWFMNDALAYKQVIKASSTPYCYGFLAWISGGMVNLLHSWLNRSWWKPCLSVRPSCPSNILHTAAPTLMSALLMKSWSWGHSACSRMMKLMREKSRSLSLLQFSDEASFGQARVLSTQSCRIVPSSTAHHHNFSSQRMCRVVVMKATGARRPSSGRSCPDYQRFLLPQPR